MWKGLVKSNSKGQKRGKVSLKGPQKLKSWKGLVKSIPKGQKFGAFGADLALVTIFSLLPGRPRTPPDLPFRLFDDVSSQFGPFAADLALLHTFSPLAGCPKNPFRLSFSMGFCHNLNHLNLWSRIFG